MLGWVAVNAVAKVEDPAAVGVEIAFLVPAMVTADISCCNVVTRIAF